MIKYFQQYDISDCGAACLAMVFSHYGKYLTIAEIREDAGTDFDGTSLKGLKNAADKNGFSAIAVKGMPEKLVLYKVPCIAHLKIEHNGKYEMHYVVIKDVKNNILEIWDPNPDKKKYKICYSEFKKEWTGYLLFLEPAPNFEANKKDTHFIFKFLPLLLKQRQLLIFAFLSSTFILGIGLLISFCHKYIYDEVLFSNSKFTLNAVLLGMLVISIFSAILDCIRNVIVKHFSYKIDLHLKFSFVDHLFKLPVSFFELRKTGEIISRINDLSVIRSVLSSMVLSSLVDVLMIIFVAPFLWFMNKTIFCITMLCAIFIGAAGCFFSKIFRKRFKRIKEESAEATSYLVSSINGISTIKSFNSEDIISKCYKDKEFKATWTGWGTTDYEIKQKIFNTIVSSITNLMILWVGCYAILNQTMSLGLLLFLTSLSSYLIDPLLRLMNLQSNLQEALISAERVGEVLCLHEEKNIPNLLIPTEIIGTIKFNKVGFHYGSRPKIIDDLSFVIQSGTINGFVGKSGCGKTTIIKLLLKFYYPEDGIITIDGNDITEIDTAALRNRIGYVPQDAYLFPDTILNNIVMNCTDVNMQDVIDICKTIGIHDFISKLPDKYNTLIGENGSGLSGGEKQRIAIARALLQKPSILVLDEATGNIDVQNEKNILDYIFSLRQKGMTVIIVSHRESTIVNCDKIYFFEDGNLNIVGNHNDLLINDERYQQYWRTLR